MLTKKITYLITALPFLSACFERVEYLEQGWNEDNQYRRLSYQTSQGSQLIPYNWFLHLTEAGSQKPIKSNSVIEQLGYLPDYFPDLAQNPDKLPIGFVKDSDPVTGDWIGLNCAACHTGQIKIDNVALRIDGAPSMGDYAKLLITVRDALADTLNNPFKLKLFAFNLYGQVSEQQVALLVADMQAIKTELSDTILRNYSPEHVPGFGRVDAFSSIRNEIFEHDLGIADNHVTPKAPVSYPFLWDTPFLDKVQWAGNVDNPYARNTGQVLGVLGRLNLQDPENLFNSSIRRDNLFNLENWLKELKAPLWPEAYLGEIDPVAAQRGKQVYSTPDHTGYSCASCHFEKDQSQNYPMTPAEDNLFGKQFIRTLNIPLAEIGTDPNTLQVVYDPTPVQTGLLESVFGSREMYGAVLLRNITAYTMGKLFTQSPALTQSEQVAYSDFRFYAPEYNQPAQIIGYKARPLAGIWATSPYLHNGSVANLFQLLLPPAERLSGFWVGNQSFDAENIGYSIDYSENTFWFDTNLSGNTNAGHEYGTQFSYQEKRDLLEYLKTL